MNEIKYSIIVPVYNVEPYLEKCINSIIMQDFKNFEIILVDDGSTDYSGNICDNYLKQYSNIQVIHKENGGLSSARNVGFEYARGEYTIFLDSDDFWIDKYFLKNITDTIVDEDLIIFNSYKYYTENGIVTPRFELPQFFYELNDNEKINYVIENNIYKACAWDKIIKTKILKDNNIIFPIGVLSEDMEWCGRILENIKKINVYSNVVYAYRQRETSISKNVNKNHLLDIYTQITSGVQNKNENTLNYYAFEYLILYSYSFILNDQEMIKKAEEISWLLQYNLSKKVKIIYKIKRIFGYRICGRVLQLYLLMR